MKHQCYKLSLVFLFGLCLSGLQAQTMYVRPTTGSQIAYPVANISKLTFNAGNLLVTNTTGANGSYLLTDLRYLNFTNLSLGLPALQKAKSFYLYPNPVSTILHLAGDDQAPSIDRIEIISFEGRLLQQQNQITGNAPKVDVTTLPQGIYFCRITCGSNSQTIKFLKQ
jgi:hypothetical protein